MDKNRKELIRLGVLKPDGRKSVNHPKGADVSAVAARRREARLRDTPATRALAILQHAAKKEG